MNANYQKQNVQDSSFNNFNFENINLSRVPGYLVLENLEKYVKSERKIMHIVLAHIAEVHSRRLYFERNFTSTYQYLRHLGYSENSAYERIRAAELLTQIPEVSDKLKSGSVNLSQLNQVKKVIRQKEATGGMISLEQASHLIEMIEQKTLFETKRVLAQELELPIVEDTRIRPQADNSVRIEMTFSEEDYLEIEKAKSHMSHVIPGGEIEKIFMHLVRKYNQKIEGKPGKEDLLTQHLVVAAEGEENPPQIPNTIHNRETFPVTVKRRVFTKAGYQCEYLNKDGTRCGSKYQLQIDHIKPLWAGGDNSEENLRCLCAAHNRKLYREQAHYTH